MSTSAPRARIVDALSGDKAPDGYFKALSEADNFAAELDEVHSLRCRVQELEASDRLARADADDAAETIGLLIRENSDLIQQLRELDEAHQITLGLLAAANAQLKRMQATR